MLTILRSDFDFFGLQKNRRCMPLLRKVDRLESKLAKLVLFDAFIILNIQAWDKDDLCKLERFLKFNRERLPDQRGDSHFASQLPLAFDALRCLDSFARNCKGGEVPLPSEVYAIRNCALHVKLGGSLVEYYDTGFQAQLEELDDSELSDLDSTVERVTPEDSDTAEEEEEEDSDAEQEQSNSDIPSSTLQNVLQLMISRAVQDLKAKVHLIEEALADDRSPETTRRVRLLHLYFLSSRVSAKLSMEQQWLQELETLHPGMPIGQFLDDAASKQGELDRAMRLDTDGLTDTCPDMSPLFQAKWVVAVHRDYQRVRTAPLADDEPYVLAQMPSGEMVRIREDADENWDLLSYEERLEVVHSLDLANVTNYPAHLDYLENKPTEETDLEREVQAALLELKAVEDENADADADVDVDWKMSPKAFAHGRPTLGKQQQVATVLAPVVDQAGGATTKRTRDDVSAASSDEGHDDEDFRKRVCRGADEDDEDGKDFMKWVSRGADDDDFFRKVVCSAPAADDDTDMKDPYIETRGFAPAGSPSGGTSATSSTAETSPRPSLASLPSGSPRLSLASVPSASPMVSPLASVPSAPARGLGGRGGKPSKMPTLEDILQEMPPPARARAPAAPSPSSRGGDSRQPAVASQPRGRRRPYEATASNGRHAFGGVFARHPSTESHHHDAVARVVPAFPISEGPAARSSSGRRARAVADFRSKPMSPPSSTTADDW